MKSKEKTAVFLAVLAAALYALSSPVSKLLLARIPSTVMAGLLYLGAGTGMLAVRLVQGRTGRVPAEKKLSKKDSVYTVGMVLLDIAAPVLLMAGLKSTSAANASLLNNFEIVATSLIDLFIFHEKISKKLWGAISLVTLASIILTTEDGCSFRFSCGSLYVILACICWGLENNCTRMISDKDPLQIVVIKGFGSGSGAMLIALAMGEQLPEIKYALCAMLLGFVAYGLSIFFYIYAQRTLGATRTSTYYAVAPFIGSALSLLIFRQVPDFSFITALIIMGAGTWLASADLKEPESCPETAAMPQ